MEWWSIVLIVVLAVILLVILVSLPDISRYLRMRRM